MTAKTWEPGPMMRKLAAGEEPYGTGPWDSKHIELDQRDAAALVAAFDRMRTVFDIAVLYVNAPSGERRDTDGSWVDPPADEDPAVLYGRLEAAVRALDGGRAA